ncbi:MAG: septum site-determining protein MinD [Candidatus Altiarchaeales archaeon]|nr:MAG: septum site-determining protein MinD [Candidatus Altiarchaeales archaeon]RLI95035.1 MAG: septum site-determining protein MinD [Candidatus Altiarchaeales archaeon]HDO82271.1 septum site-determining protein MinD [Candidatus Altiarchaeales archaeon]HEX54920.1 septum site-determining protein MinD [Candidatus Altiarchaeales archaeon]
MTRIIGVVSGKGGVGKTTLVSNLGVALAQQGAKVAVIDANLTGANLGLHFGLISYPISVHDVMRGNNTLADAIYKHPSGVDIIPASLSIDDLDVTPANIKEAILEHLGDRDFVLIDCATGLDRETLNAIEMCDEVILVTHPELPTISDALRTKTVAKRFEKNIVGVVLNRVTKEDEMKKENVSAFFDLPVIGTIPEDISVRRSIENKNPIVLEKPTHRVSQEMRRIANYLLGKKEEKKKVGIIDRIRSLLGI